MSSVFSIIVPIYNVEPFIRKCIESILNQSFDDYELILVDDGSPDNCPLICDEYAEHDSRIKVIHKKNGGLVSARNTGLHKATGEYVFYVDGDDWLSQDTLTVIWNKAISVSRPDMVIFNMTRVYEDHTENEPLFVQEGLYSEDKLEQEIKPFMMYDRRKPFYHGLVFPSSGGKVIRREILLDHYCKEESLRMGEDNAFIFECLFYSKSVFFCDDYLYMYNQLNSSSIRSNYDARRFDNNHTLTEYIENRLGNREDYLDYQINAFKAYWLIMAVFHEVKCGRNIFVSRNHISEKLYEYNTLKSIDCNQLPIFAKGFITLLKFHMYYLALIGARVISIVRK